MKPVLAEGAQKKPCHSTLFGAGEAQVETEHPDSLADLQKTVVDRGPGGPEDPHGSPGCEQESKPCGSTGDVCAVTAASWNPGSLEPYGGKGSPGWHIQGNESV